MQMSHKFKQGHANGLWLVDFDPSCLFSLSKDGCRKISSMHEFQVLRGQFLIKFLKAFHGKYYWYCTVNDLINAYSQMNASYSINAPHEVLCFIVLYCIALHCIALHCIALHCIALHCIALHCIALYWTLPSNKRHASNRRPYLRKANLVKRDRSSYKHNSPYWMSPTSQTLYRSLLTRTTKRPTKRPTMPTWLTQMAMKTSISNYALH